MLKSVLEGEYMNLDEYYQKITNMNCPILIVCGREDQICTLEGMKYFSEMITHAEMIVLDNCGHCIDLDKADEAAKSLMTFIDRHSNEPMKS